MTENDIYGSKAKYESFKANPDSFLRKPTEQEKGRKYWCANKDNMPLFQKLFEHFESKDLSYIRRNRVLTTFRFILHHVPCNLKDATRDDINRLMVESNKVHLTVESKKDFVKDLKVLWRVLFPETDEQGRVDTTITPYAIRHISGKVDASKQKTRNEKLAFSEYESIVSYFSKDSMMQAFITTATETLARPQELAFVRLRNVEVFENYAKISLTEHTKTGIRSMHVIDGLPYLLKWMSQHPLKSDKDAFLFVNERGKGQIRSENINKKLRQACAYLKVDKQITGYSLKRNGVTFRRIRGDSDVTIQKTAGWSSCKQLQIYDKTDANDVLQIELIKRGLIKSDNPEFRKYAPETKRCGFCGTANPFTERFCTNTACKRPLDQRELEATEHKRELEAIERFMQHPSIQSLLKLSEKVAMLEAQAKVG